MPVQGCENSYAGFCDERFPSPETPRERRLPRRSPAVSFPGSSAYDDGQNICQDRREKRQAGIVFHKRRRGISFQFLCELDDTAGAKPVRAERDEFLSVFDAGNAAGRFDPGTVTHPFFHQLDSVESSPCF